MESRDGRANVIQTLPLGRIRTGDLVRRSIGLPDLHALEKPVTYLYGTVMATSCPMRDDLDWVDCRVLWHDGIETLWWCGDLELVSRAEELE